MNYSIAIDGPAGAGKSTVAKIVAKKLGNPYLDTGAMYRAVAVACRDHQIDVRNWDAVRSFLDTMKIEVRYTENGEQRMLSEGEDITHLLRTEDISQGASLVSQIPEVRDKLVELQREIGHRQAVIMDGRDICTNVLSDTPNKFFITASAEERARRRVKQLIEQGQTAEYEQILRDIKQRDKQDTEREYMPLVCKEDTKLIDTTDLSIEDAVYAVISEVR
jgi:cytidylate kinase